MYADIISRIDMILIFIIRPEHVFIVSFSDEKFSTYDHLRPTKPSEER